MPKHKYLKSELLLICFRTKNLKPKNDFSAFLYSLKLTQSEFSAICRIRMNDVCRYESGRTTSILTFIKMIKSAKVHEIDLTLDLFDEET